MLSEISQSEKAIPYDFTYIWNLKNKINKQTKLKQNHRYRKQTDGCQREWVKKVKGLSTNWLIQNNHGGVKYSIGKIVNNI